jgi:PIN domain nuclease of toxin-antitoxin system
MAYVLDTEPLIAFLYDEPGHEAVAEVLGSGEECRFAEVNATELQYKIARIEGEDGEPTPESLRVADRDVRALTRQGVSLRRADWRLAAEVKAHGGLSLADANAVALAHETGAPLVAGGDGDFSGLPVDIEVERFRDHGV